MLPQTLLMVHLKKNETPYSLRNNCHFIPRNIKPVYYGSETIYLRPKIWNVVPENIEENIEDSESISFKAKSKFWKPKSCPCRLCFPVSTAVFRGNIN